MSDFRSDLKNTSFIKSPANAVEQCVHDLVDVLDRYAPLASTLRKKILRIGCLILINVQSPLGANLKVVGKAKN